MSDSNNGKSRKITNKLMIIVWFFVLIAEQFIVIKEFGSPFQILMPPTIGLTFVFIIEYFAKLQVESKITVYLRRIAAIPYFMLGFGGITTFTSTTYRNNHQPFIIPLAIIFLIIGLMLTHYKIYKKSVEPSKRIGEITVPDPKNKKNSRAISILMIMIWILVLIVEGFLVVKSFRSSFRSLIPVIGLIFIFMIEYLAKAQVESKITVYLRRISAIPFVTLGFAWITVFTLTTYRSHHRPFMIPLGIISLTIGLMLIHYNIYRKSSVPAKFIGEDETKSSHPEEDKL